MIKVAFLFRASYVYGNCTQDVLKISQVSYKRRFYPRCLHNYVILKHFKDRLTSDLKLSSTGNKISICYRYASIPVENPNSYDVFYSISLSKWFLEVFHARSRRFAWQFSIVTCNLEIIQDAHIGAEHPVQQRRDFSASRGPFQSA